MVWQEGLKEHGHQRVSSNVSVSRSVQACEKYCTSLLFNPQIINYLSVQFVKKSRCSQCWLLRCTWWQVPHWSRTVTGDQSYIMISSYSINMTIIVRFRSLDMRQVKQVKLTTCSEGEFTCNDGQCINIEQRLDRQSFIVDDSSAVTDVSPQLWPDLKLFWRVRRG